MATIRLSRFTFERMMRAVEKVRKRLLRACDALETSHIPYGVARENAAAYWISTVDPFAVRNSPAVDLVIREIDLAMAETALTSAGFVRYESEDRNLFLESMNSKSRDAVELKLADSDAISPRDVVEAVETPEFRVLSLDALSRQLLGSYRLIDRVCLRDLIEVGLLNATWCDKLPAEFSARLQAILDDPDG